VSSARWLGAIALAAISGTLRLDRSLVPFGTKLAHFAAIVDRLDLLPHNVAIAEAGEACRSAGL